MPNSSDLEGEQRGLNRGGSVAGPVFLFVGHTNRSIFSAAAQLSASAATDCKTDAGVTFYLRPFFLVLFLSALSAASETLFRGIAVQSFVLFALPGLAKTLERTLWAIGGYVAFITVLVATSKIKDEK